ncbi:MAG: DUF1538 family protein [Merdibacter sp.]
MTRLKEKINEALSSVLPITLIVLLLSATITPMPLGTILLFLAGAVLLIIGMGLFSLVPTWRCSQWEKASENDRIVSKPIYMIVITFLIGAFVTIAEPDLTVLAHQVPAIPDLTLILTVAAGVGLFLVVALLRIRWQIDLKYLLIGFYALIFLLVCFSMDSFVAVAFDSSGVTTGPITSWECKKENASGALPTTHSLFLFLPRCPSLRTRLDQSRKEPLLQGIVQRLLQVPWQ